MIRDHVTPLQAYVARLRVLLEPVLSPVRYAGTESLPDSDSFGLRVARQFPDEGWTPACLTAVGSIEEIDRRVQSLFAGGGTETLDVRQSIAELLAALHRAGEQIRDLEEQVAREFAGRTLLDAVKPGQADGTSRR